MLRNFTYINPLRYGMMNHKNVGMTVLLKKGTYHSVTPTRSFKSNIGLLSQEKFTRDPGKIIKRDGTVIRKKTTPQRMINLLDDSTMSVVTMKAAENIVKSRGLNLVKVQSKTGATRETYKLVKDSDLVKEDLQEISKQDKELKNHIFSSGICHHDIQIKVNLLMKNLLKHKMVMCTIKNAGDNIAMNKVAEKIKQEIKKTDVPVTFTSTKGTNIVTQFKVQIITDDSKRLGLDNENVKSKEK